MHFSEKIRNMEENTGEGVKIHKGGSRVGRRGCVGCERRRTAFCFGVHVN